MRLSGVPAYLAKWSPDGRWIAVRSACTLSLVPAAGGPAVDLATLCFDDVAWSPDSKRLATIGGSALSIVDVGTSAVTTVAAARVGDHLAWSGDGRYVAFTDGRPFNVVRVAEPVAHSRIWNHGRGDWAAWAPDGSLVFPHPTAPNVERLVADRPRGGGRRTLDTAADFGTTPAAWSRGGSLAYVRNRRAASGRVIVRRPSGPVRVLAGPEDLFAQRGLFWSTDGRRILEFAELDADDR